MTYFISFIILIKGIKNKDCLFWDFILWASNFYFKAYISKLENILVINLLQELMFNQND